LELNYSEKREYLDSYPLNLQIEHLNEKLERAKKDKSVLLKKRISDLPLSNRTLNALGSLDCKTLGDVVLLETSNLMKVRNFGNKCIFELDDYIIFRKENNYEYSRNNFI
jgi:DNA-directed RNA polymerase alpha subunit